MQEFSEVLVLFMYFNSHVQYLIWLEWRVLSVTIDDGKIICILLCVVSNYISKFSHWIICENE